MDPLIELRKPAGSQDEKNSKTAKDERTKHSARKSYRKHKTKPGKEDLSHNERQKINSSSFPALGSPAVNEDDDNATSKPSRASVPKLEKSLRREPGKSDCGKMAVLPDVAHSLLPANKMPDRTPWRKAKHVRSIENTITPSVGFRVPDNTYGLVPRDFATQIRSAYQKPCEVLRTSTTAENSLNTLPQFATSSFKPDLASPLPLKREPISSILVIRKTLRDLASLSELQGDENINKHPSSISRHQHPDSSKMQAKHRGPHQLKPYEPGAGTASAMPHKAVTPPHVNNTMSSHGQIHNEVVSHTGSDARFDLSNYRSPKKTVVPKQDNDECAKVAENNAARNTMTSTAQKRLHVTPLTSQIKKRQDTYVTKSPSHPEYPATAKEKTLLPHLRNPIKPMESKHQDDVDIYVPPHLRTPSACVQTQNSSIGCSPMATGIKTLSTIPCTPPSQPSQSNSGQISPLLASSEIGGVQVLRSGTLATSADFHSSGFQTAVLTKLASFQQSHISKANSAKLQASPLGKGQSEALHEAERLQAKSGSATSMVNTAVKLGDQPPIVDRRESPQAAEHRSESGSDVEYDGKGAPVLFHHDGRAKAVKRDILFQQYAKDESQIDPTGEPVCDPSDASPGSKPPKVGSELAQEDSSGNKPNQIRGNMRKVLEYEPCLVDWEGKWMPAPIEWDARPSFNNNDRRHLKMMDRWMNSRVADARFHPKLIDQTTEEFTSGSGPASGLVRLWDPYPVKWTCHRADDAFTHAKIDQTAADSIEKFVKKREEKIEAKKKQKRDEREFAKAQARVKYVAPPNPHVPLANIYIRPAQHSDMRQVSVIYNQYVRTSPMISDLTDTDEYEWRSRWQTAKDEKLPFLVAVLINGQALDQKADELHAAWYGRPSRPQNRGVRNKARAQATKEEIIVGFVLAEDFGSKVSAFQHTAELQVFVHDRHLRLGVGKTLIDRILPALDANHISRQGTKFLAENELDYEVGGLRQIRRIIMNLAFFEKERPAIEWIGTWIAKNWDFEHCGTLPGVGFKDGKSYSIGQFIKETRMVHGASTWEDNRKIIY